MPTLSIVHMLTWNLNGNVKAAGYALSHLTALPAAEPFIACLQEAPGASPIMQAKGRARKAAALKSQGVCVVQTATLIPGLALVHSSHFDSAAEIADEDGEFVAAMLTRRVDGKKVFVVGVHAKSKLDMPDLQDHGGARALLRYATSQISSPADATLMLGDFNSDLADREMQSWYGFHAISNGIPTTKPSYAKRRGVDHTPLHVIVPKNHELGTFWRTTNALTTTPTIDFFIVDSGTFARSSSTIVGLIGAATVRDVVTNKPNVSDHAPVVGEMDV